MGAWCSCSSSQEIIIGTPKGSPILRPNSETFQFPPPLDLPERLTTIHEDDEFECETDDDDSPHFVFSRNRSSFAPRRTRVKFIIPPPSVDTQRSQNWSYRPCDQSCDRSCDEGDPYETVVPLNRSSLNTANEYIVNPQLSHDHRPTDTSTTCDASIMTLFESSNVYTNGSGLPFLGSGISAAKALQIHNFLYVIQNLYRLIICVGVSV